MNIKDSSDNQPSTTFEEDEPRSELRRRAEALLSEVSGSVDSISQVEISLTLTHDDLREIRELASDGLKKLETSSGMNDHTLQMLGHTGAEIDSIRERFSSGIAVLKKLDSLLARDHAPLQERLKAISDSARTALEAMEDKGFACDVRLPTHADANSAGMVDWLRSGIWMRGPYNETPVDATRWRILKK